MYKPYNILTINPTRLPPQKSRPFGPISSTQSSSSSLPVHPLPGGGADVSMNIGVGSGEGEGEGEGDGEGEGEGVGVGTGVGTGVDGVDGVGVGVGDGLGHQSEGLILNTARSHGVKVRTNFCCEIENAREKLPSTLPTMMPNVSVTVGSVFSSSRRLLLLSGGVPQVTPMPPSSNRGVQEVKSTVWPL